MYYIKPRKDKKEWRFRLVFILVSACILLIAANEIFSCLIRDTVVSLAKNAASKAVNNAALEVLDETEYVYSDFIEIKNDRNGEIQVLSAKSEAVNRFSSMLSSAVINALDSKEALELEIPVGTLTDIGVLYGIGPDIRIRIEFYGDIKTTLKSSFTSVGINQTNHRLICVVSANITIITPSFTEHITVNGEYLIAETVIVGNIPGSYTNVNGDDSGIIGQIFDYADVE